MATPPTSYLLDTIKEMYIRYSDPSQTGRDALDGLKEKENNLKKFTHEMLSEKINTYEADEAQIAATLGDNFLKLCLGVITIEDLIMVPPTMVFSNFYPYDSSSSSSSSSLNNDDLLVDRKYLLIATASGGTQSLSSFTYEWGVLQSPEGGEVHFHEEYSEIVSDEWIIGTVIDFTKAGTYALQLTITSSNFDFLQTITRASAIVNN